MDTRSDVTGLVVQRGDGSPDRVRDGSLEIGLLTGQSLRQARRFVRVRAEQCGFEDRGDDADLVAAELLEGPEGEWVPTAVRVVEADGGLLLGVDLGGPQPLRLREHSEALLAAVSTAWGWQPRPHGVHVWSLLGREDATATSGPRRG